MRVTIIALCVFIKQLCAAEYKDLNVYGKAKHHTVETAKKAKKGFITASNGTWKFLCKVLPRVSWSKKEKGLVDKARLEENEQSYKELNK